MINKKQIEAWALEALKQIEPQIGVSLQAETGGAKRIMPTVSVRQNAVVFRDGLPTVENLVITAAIDPNLAPQMMKEVVFKIVHSFPLAVANTIIQASKGPMPTVANPGKISLIDNPSPPKGA